MNKKNRVYHFFASDWTADRADLTGLDNRKPLIEKDELLSIKLFLLNEEVSIILSQYIADFDFIVCSSACGMCFGITESTH
jgi:hypothetical protein